MRILFISYWSISDPLTIATVFPSLRALSILNNLKQLVLVTPEVKNRDILFEPDSSLTKIEHYPIQVKSDKIWFGERIVLFNHYQSRLIALAKEKRISHIIARSALAGSIAFNIWSKLKIPFYVESFEPHSQYMLQNAIWHKIDPRFVFQNRMEKRIKKYASGLLPVSLGYYNDLGNEGVPNERMKIVPCTIDLGRFDLTQRKRTREVLGFRESDIVGIYVGKFDGLYLKEKAFDVLSLAHNYFPSLKTILLTGYPADSIKDALVRRGISKESFEIHSVAFEEVPMYLIAADFAYCFVQSHNYSHACSPIKNGEYWAAGLPILIPENIGDDSDIIYREGGGAVFDEHDPASIETALESIKSILTDPKHKNYHRKLAEKYRSPKLIDEAYRYFFGTSNLV